MKNQYLQLIQDNFENINYKKAKIIKKWWSNDIIILDDNIVFRFPKEYFVK